MTDIIYDEEYGMLSINDINIPSDDGKCFFVERSQIENIKLDQLPFEVDLAICRKVYKKQPFDTREFTISKLERDSIKVTFDDGLMEEDFNEIIQEYNTTAKKLIQTKVDIISKVSSENGNISIDEYIDEDENIYITYSLIAVGENLGMIIQKADEFSNMIDNLIDNQLSPITKDIDELINKIDILQRFFEDNYGFTLFKSYSLKSVINLRKSVKDIDDLTVRLKDLVTQLIENINKVQLDKAISCESKGSIKSLENFLKDKFIEDTHMIEDEIIQKLWALYNLRTEYVHEKNRNYKKALNILHLNETDLPEFIWRTSLKAALDSFGKTLDLFMQEKYEKDGDYFIELAREKLQTEARVDIANLISENEGSEAPLHILVNLKEIVDTELAKMLGQNVNQLRSTLFPFLSHVILYTYKGHGKTLIWVIDEVLPILKGVIISNEN